MPKVQIIEGTSRYNNDGNRIHHARQQQGIQKFVPIDGEGVNEKSKPTIKICKSCNKEIEGTRVSTSLNEYYHPKCYYALENERQGI